MFMVWNDFYDKFICLFTTCIVVNREHSLTVPWEVVGFDNFVLEVVNDSCCVRSLGIESSTSRKEPGLIFFDPAFQVWVYVFLWPGTLFLGLRWNTKEDRMPWSTPSPPASAWCHSQHQVFLVLVSHMAGPLWATPALIFLCSMF